MALPDAGITEQEGTCLLPALMGLPGRRCSHRACRRCLGEHVGKEVFRLDADTVGVAGAELTHRLLDARAATEAERPTFKPLHGRSIPRTDASKLMQALGRDVREALKRPVSADLDLCGPWPHVGHVYLRDLLLAGDPLRLRLLMDRMLQLTPKLTWAVIAAGAAMPFKLQYNASALATLTAAAGSYDERRYAMGLYRRTAAPVCLSISTLVANALWLGSPFDPASAQPSYRLRIAALAAAVMEHPA